jgi:hypothetical protein
MIVKHLFINKEYDIDKVKYDITTVGDLKNHLLTLICGIKYDNIKILGYSDNITDEIIITDDMKQVGMVIVPIKCEEHN